MKNNNYSFPNGFDPHHAVYALKCIAYFLHDYYAEGPGVYRTVPEGHHANLLGLAWMQQRVANELYDYFAALDEAGVKLPMSEADFEERDNSDCIRETPPRYAARSR